MTPEPSGPSRPTDTDDMPEGETYSDFILEVVSDVEVNAKDDSVSSQKKVKDANDSEGEVSDWQDSADHDIGDSVPFQLKATIANDFDKYETYKLIFHDKQCDGLTFEPDSVKAYVDGTEVTGFTVVENPDDDCTFEIVFDDLTKIDGVQNGSEVTVEYTSVLNTDAVIGAEGNPNEMCVEYSNNPNADVEGIEDTTGKTPWDKVIVFTYMVSRVDICPTWVTASLRVAVFKLLSDFQVIFHICPLRRPGWISLWFSYLTSNL